MINVILKILLTKDPYQTHHKTIHNKKIHEKGSYKDPQKSQFIGRIHGLLR